MRATFKRDMLRLQNEMRSEMGTRFWARIAQNPPNQSRSAAPFSPEAETPNADADRIVTGKCIYQPTRDVEDYRGTGSMVTRKAYMTVHPMFEETLRKAYAVTIRGEPGEFEIVGEPQSIDRVLIKVFLQARQ